MKHHVVLEKLCKCALNNSTEQIRSFDTKDEAEEHAYEWADSLNNSFCGKHGFDVVEVNDNFQETSLRERYPCFVISVEDGGFVEACEL